MFDGEQEALKQDALQQEPLEDAALGELPLPHLVIMTPSADLYGSDRALLAALAEFTTRFRVTLVSAADGPMLRAAERLGAGIVITPDWALRRSGLALRALPTTLRTVLKTCSILRRIDRDQGIDLLYVNTVANACLPLLSVTTAAPILVHAHEVPIDRPRLAGLLFWVANRVGTAIVANSRFTADEIEKLVPGAAARTSVVLNGIDVSCVSPGPGSSQSEDSEVSQRRGPSGSLQIVCVGRLHPRKGQMVLLEALALATQRGQNWTVHFWGDALEEHRQLEEELHGFVSRHDLGARTVFHGYSDDLVRQYQDMDVAVIPSVLPEAFSLVTAEAQMAGLPVVATGPGGPDEIVVEGATGYIVGFDDSVAIYQALSKLEAPEVRSAFGAAGRDRMLAEFTAERYSRELTDTLVALLVT